MGSIVPPSTAAAITANDSGYVGLCVRALSPPTDSVPLQADSPILAGAQAHPRKLSSHLTWASLTRCRSAYHPPLDMDKACQTGIRFAVARAYRATGQHLQDSAPRCLRLHAETGTFPNAAACDPDAESHACRQARHCAPFVPAVTRRLWQSASCWRGKGEVALPGGFR